MTDFIHEPPKEPQAAPPAQEELPLDEKTGQKRVYGYIFILFIVAFALLVWSFLMNQRGTDQVLSELRGNADALQTTLTRNVELEREVDALEERIEALTKEKAALEQSAAEQQKVVDQLGEDIKSLDTKSWLCYALLLMDDGDHEAAARALASWGSANDYQAVIEAHDNGSWNDAEAPILLGERYNAMLEQLVMEGYLTIAQDGSLKSWHVDTP
jgi:cell division protein FtsB